MHIHPIPAFKDNYIWCMEADGHAIVVDPGDAAPVAAHLAARGLELAAILITHHHADHTGGIAALTRAKPVPVFGPAGEEIEGVTVTVREGDTVRVADLGELDATFGVIKVPGHTLGHVAYYRPNALFCGDTLFSAGCGRLFEGSPAQMFGSLERLAALPAATEVFCTHEYTEANLRFALAVEPGNAALTARAREVAALRAAGRPSLPSRIDLELATNPFLRARVPEVAASARAEGAADESPLAVFTALRAWKDRFRA